MNVNLGFVEFGESFELIAETGHNFLTESTPAINQNLQSDMIKCPQAIITLDGFLRNGRTNH
jgi:hypothetical protein